MSRQRVYASLLMLGAGVLLFRTVMMLSQGAMRILAGWAGWSLIAECAVDAGCFLAGARWWAANDKRFDSLPLRLGAAAAFFHAFRVFVFILGRTGPWENFDVRPEYAATHAQRWSWGGVIFAGVMSLLGMIGVVVLWQIRRRVRYRNQRSSG